MPGTLGSVTQTALLEHRKDVIARPFTTSAAIPSGSPVQLASTGLVGILAAGTHIGTAWNGGASGEEVTVETKFTHVVRTKIKAATAAVAIGDPLKLDATTATEVVVEKAVSTNKAVGIALQAGAAEGYIEVGMVEPFTVA